MAAGPGAGAGAGAEERARKLYRYVTDIARRIDEATPACRSTADLFTTYLEGNRQKLRDNCEKLMFLMPLQYGRKSLELLWRKAYYETVSTAKKLRSKEEQCDDYIFTHIVCGIGHYHHIISRIITEMDLQLSSLDYPLVNWDDDSKIITKTPVDDDFKQWGASIVHSCLIYLGDLSRYQSEMSDNSDISIAARYYLQAAYIDLCSGMPYNQLGNLYTDRNHNLDSVCYYIHCLNCSVPFEGAEGNLARLFEKNAQYVESISSEQVEGLPQLERVRLTIGRFLTLAENWYLTKENVDIGHLCNVTAHDLKICLGYQPPVLPDINKNYEEHLQIRDEEILNPSYLNDDAIYKIVLICLFCIEKLNEIDANRAFAVKAFTLALFSQLLQKLLERMHKCGFQNPSRSIRRPSHQHVIENIHEDSKLIQIVEQKNGESMAHISDVKVNGHSSDVEEKLVNGNGKSNGKKTTAKRRRRRRLNSSESSEVSDDETESSSTKSEKSETEDEDSSGSENTYVSDESNNELSDDEDAIIVKEKEIIGVNDEKKETSDKIIKKTDENSVSELNSEVKGKLDEADIQRFLRSDNFLPSLKLLQDWILTETDLIMSCGESGDALFQSVVDLLNILQTNFKSASSKHEAHSKILNFAKSTAAKLSLEYKVIPLPEDINLRGTNICKFDNDAAEWMLLKKYNPTVYEENVIRILNFINFGHQIAKIIPRIRYNRSLQVFFMKKSQNSKTLAKMNRKEPKNKKSQRAPAKAPHHPGRHAADTSLMRNLGKLWLQSRVRELESAVRTGGREALPAYVVVDTDALTHHTKLVKQLVKLRKFVVLVPTVVLQSIDELKKEQGGARDAIRWLETQLQSGSRFLRTQRPSETRALPLLKYPRKAPKQVHHFMQVIEFCHHFVAKDDESSQGGNGDPDTKMSEKKNSSVLVLLTGSKLSDSEDVKDFSYTGVAQSAGVSVDSIVHFVSKWRHLVNKAGKKR